MTGPALYAEIHSEILAELEENAAPVSFSHTSPGTHDAATGTFSGGGTSMVAGRAIAVRGSGERYKQLVMTKEEVVVLLFRPTTFGEKPGLGWAVTWGGQEYTVDVVDPVAPAGTLVMARVMVSR